MNVVFARRNNMLKEKLPRLSLSEAGLELLAGLSAYYLSRRLTAEEALKYPWLREVPVPTSLQGVLYEVISYVTEMAPLVCISLILDSLQGVLSGITVAIALFLSKLQSSILF